MCNERIGSDIGLYSDEDGILWNDDEDFIYDQNQGSGADFDDFHEDMSYDYDDHDDILDYVQYNNMDYDK